jgi:uncharacterized membrane protein
VLGLAFAYWITVAAPMQWGSDLPTLFLAGAIAICAMILPGISGSFILLLLGLYSVVLGAVKDFNLLVLAVFASGCLVGILSFARLLSWLLSRWRDLSLAFLTGLMLGSLNKGMALERNPELAYRQQRRAGAIAGKQSSAGAFCRSQWSGSAGDVRRGAGNRRYRSGIGS